MPLRKHLGSARVLANSLVGAIMIFTQPISAHKGQDLNQRLRQLAWSKVDRARKTRHVDA